MIVHRTLRPTRCVRIVSGTFDLYEALAKPALDESVGVQQGQMAASELKQGFGKVKKRTESQKDTRLGVARCHQLSEQKVRIVSTEYYAQA